MKKKLYGLFLYTYDYYEWEELYVASYSKKKLEEYYKNSQDLYADKALIYINIEEHRKLANSGEAHWMITEIEVL